MAKKIGAIVSLSIIGILIIATIVMANVSVNYGVVCATPNVVYVQYEKGALRNASNDKDEIVSYISNASQEKVLSALFNGELNKKATLTAKTGKLSYNDSNFYVSYVYDEAQTLKDNDGKDVNYDELVFEIAETSETQYKVYVITSSNANTTYSYYYTIDADFTNAYNFLVANYN